MQRPVQLLVYVLVFGVAILLLTGSVITAVLGGLGAGAGWLAAAAVLDRRRDAD